MGSPKYGEFSFSKDHGYSGSCGGTSVKGYMRGGAVKGGGRSVNMKRASISEMEHNPSVEKDTTDSWNDDKPVETPNYKRGGMARKYAKGGNVKGDHEPTVMPGKYFTPYSLGGGVEKPTPVPKGRASAYACGGGVESPTPVPTGQRSPYACGGGVESPTPIPATKMQNYKKGGPMRKAAGGPVQGNPANMYGDNVEIRRIARIDGETMHPGSLAAKGYAKGGRFIQSAIKHPGALHRELGVPMGKKIPATKLDRAAHAGGKLGQRARFAETLKGLNHHAQGGRSASIGADKEKYEARGGVMRKAAGGMARMPRMRKMARPMTPTMPASNPMTPMIPIRAQRPVSALNTQMAMPGASPLAATMRRSGNGLARGGRSR